jgi:hypothetical protein
MFVWMNSLSHILGLTHCMENIFWENLCMNVCHTLNSDVLIRLLELTTVNLFGDG